jgi:hypothetical protein
LDPIIIVVGVAVPIPRVFHNGRRNRRVDYRHRGLKTHGSVHLALELL